MPSKATHQFFEENGINTEPSVSHIAPTMISTKAMIRVTYTIIRKFHKTMGQRY